MASSKAFSAAAALAACSVSLGSMALLDISLRPDFNAGPEAELWIARSEPVPPPPGGELPVGADWSNWSDSGRRHMDFARSQALCRAVLDERPPEADKPDEQTLRQLRGCNSEKLLFGLGTPPDPLRARHCAFVEVETNDYYGPDLPFHGRSMLMHLYANGIGVERNLDLALHFACGLSGAPAEMDARVLHLAELRDSGSTGKDFSFCDDITSGYAGGQCAAHRARLATARRDARLEMLTRHWKPAERAALDRVRALHEEYAALHATNEQSPSGTLRIAFTVKASEELAEQFLDTVHRLSEGRGPAYDRRQFRTADTRLNIAYRGILDAEILDYWNSSEAEARETQRAWLRYRDALLDFAESKFPDAGRDSVAGWLTDQRTAVLAHAMHGCRVPKQCPELPLRVPPYEDVVSTLKEPNR